ncbi:MAG: polysaccharide biosynthesis C-terminal domain-containing protein, partial [Chloroflexota bacterium]|nr:polysaccharide biosynthesis C-terminal domain-containing protein [Chloroflexota bacterium]
LQSGLQSLTLPFLTLLMPMFSDLRARGHHEEVVRRFALSTRVALQLTLPLAFGLALFAPEAVDLWLGDEAPAVTADIIVVLMAAQTISITATPAEKLLVGVGRVKAIGALAVVEGLSNLTLSIVLIHAYGAIGAALGTLMTSGVLTPIKVPLACRATGARPGDFLLRGVMPAVLSSLPGIGAMLAVYGLLSEGSLRLLVGLAVGLGLPAAIATGQVGIGRLAELARSATGGRGQRTLQLESEPPAESPIGAVP